MRVPVWVRMPITFPVEPQLLRDHPRFQALLERYE
jgi:hypothetical protein